MSQNKADEPSTLPQVKLTELGPGQTLLNPLSRKGVGPGLIILTSSIAPGGVHLEDGVPSPQMKWGEEGYTVVEIRDVVDDGSQDPIKLALEALAHSETCQPKEQVGLVVYDSEIWYKVASYLPNHPEIIGAVVYGDAAKPVTTASVPILQHLAGAAVVKPETPLEGIQIYNYASATSYLFATPFQETFHYSSEAVSHTRNLTFLKKLMNGPYFDLETIWDEHTYYEFDKRSVPDTMSTMVQEPYVNHIPTLTGGIGRERLSHFYQNHFVFQNPKDTELELISRTVGIDRVVDEFIYKFTHDMQIDWLLPGIPPTGRKAEIPFTAVVNIRGDRLYHEHISWDQTTALFQLGLMPEYLPYPYPLPDGTCAGAGKRFEYRVPGAGRETAEKMKDKNSVESNGMFEHRIRTTSE
ncbi:unnamed protein product [Penicillium glandicola]